MGAAFKGHTSYELIAHATSVPMDCAVVLCPERVTKGYFPFLAAEAAWILSGSNRVAEIKPFAKSIATFSDDGRFFDGAYGPKFVEQVGWVARKIDSDPATRQAVATIWRERPGSSKDVPCTVALQWLVRDGLLRCVATMRSSDAITGWPFDVHNFSMMSAYLALMLREREGFRDLRLGDLTLIAGSQHLYERDRDLATRCVWDGETLRDSEAISLASIELDEFVDPDHLVSHLWRIAQREPRGPWPACWLAETLP